MEKKNQKRLNRRGIRKIISFAAMIICISIALLAVVSCTQAESVIEEPDVTEEPPTPEPAPTPEPIPEPTPEPSPEASPDISYTNPLTGEPVDEDRRGLRPFAVSINNAAASLPQWGIGEADMIIEFVVENATRFIVFYSDVSGVGNIGSIRSLRTSSQEITESFDAIFAHWSGRTYDDQPAGGINGPVTRVGTIDAEQPAIGQRMKDTGRDLEHTGYTTGQWLIEGIPATYRLKHEPGFELPLRFKDNGTPAGGQDAREVTVSFYSNSKTSKFTYENRTGTYGVEQYDQQLIDGNTDKPLSFTNVLVLKMDMKMGFNRPGHTYIETRGDGDGYFICGGKYTEITWRRGSETHDPFEYFLPDGSPLELGIGKTFICMVRSEQIPLFE